MIYFAYFDYSPFATLVILTNDLSFTNEVPVPLIKAACNSNEPDFGMLILLYLVW